VAVGIDVGLGVGEGSRIVICGWNVVVGAGLAAVVDELHPEINSSATANTVTRGIGRDDDLVKNLLQAMALGKHHNIIVIYAFMISWQK
jgi:hypothetical protein